MHHQGAKVTARSKVHKNALCWLEQILEVKIHKTAAVHPLPSHQDDQDIVETAG